MKKVVPVFRLAAQAFANLKANDPIRMAAATAFFSFFALPSILIILSQLYGNLLSSNDRVSWQLFRKMADVLGYQSARQIQDISQHLQQRRSSTLLTVLNIFVLLLASTTLFAIIKNSLNQLWSVKPSIDRHVWHVALDKLVALAIIVFSGFLFMASLTISRTLAPLNEQLFSGIDDWSGNAGQHMLSVATLTIWFAIVFKYLPDIRIHWQAVGVGALVTALLVELGEAILNRLLINSSVSSLYGTSGAIMLILLFVFYSALIFYYGASFTRYYAQWVHLDAEPGANAVAYQIKELDNETSSSTK
ncbi:YihY/virulence factor BrkB family protein [Spirosoma sp.]|uniref:YihY/virulence factor BrkB family protein n=1 Tax=Spirosoma sp. TaxID=1899569 RepID=UPI003B3A82B7